MFDPAGFLRVAEEMAGKGDEASARTSAGRAYYGAFLLARERLKPKAKTPEVHLATARELLASDPYAGNCLRQLRRLRNAADYDLRAAIGERETRRALGLARAVAEAVKRGRG